MRFKVGDKVRVLSEPYYTNPSNLGKIFEVVEIIPKTISEGLYELSNGITYFKSRLEPVEKYKTDAEIMQELIEGRNNKPSIQDQLEENLLKLFNDDDKVNSPAHYNKGEIEVIDIIKQLTQGYNPFEAYLVGNAIKYLARANFKENKQQDLEKAQWHINKLLEEEE